MKSRTLIQEARRIMKHNDFVRAEFKDGSRLRIRKIGTKFVWFYGEAIKCMSIKVFNDKIAEVASIT